MRREIIKTARAKVRRLPERGAYDRVTIYRILDEGFVCHVGFTVDGQTFVIPTAYARVGDRLIIHGSAASRMLRALAWEVEACVTVTLVDGLVLARSTFNHSLNYRSVIIFGTAAVVSDEREKLKALEAFTEHIVPGRWRDVRPPTSKELKATTVLSLPLTEASAKVREGPPIDDEADYAASVWAGVVPLRLVAGEPVGDPRLPEGISLPDYVANSNGRRTISGEPRARKGDDMRANQTTPRNVDEYIAGFPPDVQKILGRVRLTIRRAAPEAEETIKYKIPAFTLKGNLIYFAAHKNHIGIYPAPKGTREFQKEIAGYSAGKGTIRFPLGAPVPLDLLRKIVEFRVKENLERAEAKRR